MTYKCEITSQSSKPVLTIRTTTSVNVLPEFLGKAYGMIAQYLGELGKQPGGPPFAAYYNMDMDHLEVEAGFPVMEELPGRGEIIASEISAGRSANCLYTGPYSEMSSAYDALNAWMKENDHQPTGTVYEFYLNDPSVTASEAMQTQIVFPLLNV